MSTPTQIDNEAWLNDEMRTALLLVQLIASSCGKAQPTDPVDPPKTSPSATTSTPLAVDHATLLEPDDVVGTRVVDQDALATTMKDITTMVIAYDAKHSNVLPPELDVVVVVRPSGMRLWLVGAAGDLDIPELEAAVAKLPKVAVREGNVAVITTFAHAKSATREPYLPTSWKAAAGKNGSDIDSVIDVVWPR